MLYHTYWVTLWTYNSFVKLTGPLEACPWKMGFQTLTNLPCIHYSDVIMGTIAYQITILMIVFSTVNSDADQRKHQSSASWPFVRGIHRGPAQVASNALKMFPFDDVIMYANDIPQNPAFDLSHDKQSMVAGLNDKVSLYGWFSKQVNMLRPITRGNPTSVNI